MLYNNSKWIEDVDKVSEMVFPELTKLSGKTVLITGATGLICSSLVDLLFRYNDLNQQHIQIVAAGRTLEKMKKRFGRMIEREDFTFLRFDASKAGNQIDVQADYIIYGASNASPRAVMEQPVETMLSNFLGMKEILDYAHDNNSERVMYISSSEVYGKKESSCPYQEDDYGYVDLLNPRNCYAIGKRAAETLCASYNYEYGVDTVIVRPGHIYGPTASKNDNRVSSAWAFAAANGEDIVMKSDGAQLRSYCYCLDCSTAILKVLLNGENTHAYNISNPNSVISIREMAEILAKAGNVKLIMDLPTEEEKKAFNPMSNSSLNSESLQALGWRGLFDARTGFEHTVKIINETF